MRNRPSTFNIDCINDYDDSTTPASMNDQRRDFYYIYSYAITYYKVLYFCWYM